jgi:hypothetical protein
MSTILFKAIITGLLFIFTVASGIWLHRLGKPLNLLISNLHKLISLATMLLAGVVVFLFAKIAAMAMRERRPERRTCEIDNESVCQSNEQGEKSIPTRFSVGKMICGEKCHRAKSSAGYMHPNQVI